eukprot:gene6375-12889_t
MFDRMLLEGVGFTELSTTPGSFDVEVKTWKPVGNTWINMCEYFVGGTLRLKNNNFIKTSDTKSSVLNKFGVVTESSAFKRTVDQILMDFRRGNIDASTSSLMQSQSMSYLQPDVSGFNKSLRTSASTSQIRNSSNLLGQSSNNRKSLSSSSSTSSIKGNVRVMEVLTRARARSAARRHQLQLQPHEGQPVTESKSIISKVMNQSRSMPNLNRKIKSKDTTDNSNNNNSFSVITDNSSILDISMMKNRYMELSRINEVEVDDEHKDTKNTSMSMSTMSMRNGNKHSAASVSVSGRNDLDMSEVISPLIRTAAESKDDKDDEKDDDKDDDKDDVDAIVRSIQLWFLLRRVEFMKRNSIVLTSLEDRISRLSFLFDPSTKTKTTNTGISGNGPSSSSSSSSSSSIGGSAGTTSKSRAADTKAWWVEDLTIKVFHGEFKFVPSATVDLFRMFSRLYDWIAEGEMSGRFVFDMGQSLYEGGRPQVGAMMMRRGLATADPQLEGAVSMEVIRLRLALDFPVVPESAIVSAYLNITDFLSQTSQSFHTIDLENVLDVSWPLPLWVWSALPVSPVIKELMYRFDNGPIRRDVMSQDWISRPNEITNRVYDTTTSTPSGSSDRLVAGTTGSLLENGKSKSRQRRMKSSLLPLEIGILGGHMSGHPVGQMALRSVTSTITTTNSTTASTNTFPLPSHFTPPTSLSLSFRLTLLALPLRPDHTTSQLATKVSVIVNLPADPQQAWTKIETLNLDVLLFPDWQPFPDQQSLYLQSRRMAPVQICFYVRGGGCAGTDRDYYVLPSELGPGARSGSSGSGSGSGFRPSWLQQESSQVVVLDWPVFTPQVIRDVGANAVTVTTKTKTMENDDDDNDGYDSDGFDSNELEGPIFFEGQPVAVLPLHPTHLHPLMDDALFQIMHSVPSLQIIVVLPDTFLRLLQLLRLADVALDSFPI